MTTGAETFYQTPPSLKIAAGLADTREYAVIWTGQSNARPTGYPSDGLEFASELELQPTGLDLATVVIPNNTSRSNGMIEVISVDSSVTAGQWDTNTWLRLGSPVAPEKGYAKVVKSLAGQLHVRWISTPTNNQTVAGYLVRENGKFSAYTNIRVLTPFMPVTDIRPPLESSGSSDWSPPEEAPYKTANASIALGGQRLNLPFPYTLPSTVTSFSDLGLFLPLTRREGAEGYGISEIADSTFSGSGDPTGHPIATISGQVFTFGNAISSDADLKAAFVLVDWEQGGATKRSWAKVDSNTTTSFTTDSTTWLGDGIPDTPSTSAVTVDSATDRITWTAHGLSVNDPVFFTGTSAPGGLSFNRVYYVDQVIDANTFTVAASTDHPAINITTNGTSVSATRAWRYTVWVPHWKDNPHMWLPGPEFGYANEDQQPANTYVHFRARGQLNYARTGTTTPFDGTADHRFGALLPFAWRISAALGKQINVVALGINRTPMAPDGTLNDATFAGTIGWWDAEQHGFALPLENTSSNLANRLKRLIGTIAPAALTAESNTKTLNYVAAAHVQGESDSLYHANPELYASLVTDFKEWVREQTASYTPYANGAKMPFVQPVITHYPWQSSVTSVTILSGSGTPTTAAVATTDTLGLVNDAIKRSHTAEEFAGYVLTDDLPKLVYNDANVDPSRFSGEGMAVLGARLAGQALVTIDHALSYGSSALNTVTNARLVRIINQALYYVGQGANPITALTDTSTEATLANAFIQEAIEQLLSLRQWSWAIRTEPATKVLHDDPNFDYAYVVPGRALTLVAIDPPQSEDETAGQTYVSVLAPIQDDEYVVSGAPEQYEIRSSAAGDRVVFTNVPEEAGDLTTATYYADGLLHPERLPTRPVIRYVDKRVDPDSFSPSFATALSWLLASMMAPALVKGQVGEQIAQACYIKCAAFLRAEGAHESLSQQLTTEHRPAWIQGR